MSKDKRNVAQKIEDLEAAMINAYQMMNNMAADIQATKAGGDLLGSKTQAIISLLESATPVTEASVVNVIQTLRMERMAADIKGLVAQGILSPADAATERSFIVGRDLSKDGSGTVVSPRMQFVVSNLEPETKDKFIGAKAGDILVFSPEKNQFEIQEIYAINKRPDETAPEASEEATAESEQASS